MKRVERLIISLIICLCALFPGCHPENEMYTRTTQEETVDSLDIFLVGDAIHEMGVNGDEENVFYTTMMTLGDYDGNTMCYGEKGFVFYDAFEEYQAKTGIKLNLHWFPYPENMESALSELDSSKLPDLILSNATSKADYYLYMKKGIFADLSDFVEEDAIYTEGKYYNEILKAGTYINKQYLLPIMFNIDTVMGCQSVWNELGLHLEDIETHKELMDLLINVQKREQIEEVCGQFISALAYYTPHILYAATGSNWIDYETEQEQLDESTFYQMAVFYKNFLHEQYGELNANEQIMWADSKHLLTWRECNNNNVIEEILYRRGCFLEGGSGYNTYLHSAPAQARYYESRYTDINEQFKILPIPNKDGGTTAHVTYFGGVLSTSQKSEAAYQFLRYLMDQDWFYHFGMSVNRAANEKQLEDLASSEYQLYPGWQQYVDDGIDMTFSNRDYIIRPLTQETKDHLLNMIDEISSVTIPNWPVYAILREQMENYSLGKISLEEAYQESVEKLKNYIQDMS